MNDAQRAIQIVAKALQHGTLKKPAQCEVCGRDAAQVIPDKIFGGEDRTIIVAHHWRGYDYPLEVWWVCSSCNRRLIGRHDGSVTLEQARRLVRGMNWFVPK